MSAVPVGDYAVRVGVGCWALALGGGEEVRPEAVVAKGCGKDTRTPIKILGGGELDKALNVRMAMYSRSAVDKIEAAGGKAEPL